MNQLTQADLDHLVRGLMSRKHIYGALFHVSSQPRGLELISAAGEMTPDRPYYIASINKFFVSAVVLRLCAQQQMGLQDKLADYLDADLISGLHVYEGRDYSEEISIQHLLSQTSGLPCYLMDRQANGARAMDELEAGSDQPWPVERVISIVKQMKPHFRPGDAGRAKYVDTNHQILGVVIEKVTGQPVENVLASLFAELGMRSTFVCEHVGHDEFAPLYFKSRQVQIPQFLNSTQNDIISTAKDQMVFLKAFFDGYFYPKDRLHELEKWNNIFFPFRYGVGVQKFYTPRIFSPFQSIPDMVGHCGSTGSVAFYVPDREVHITGTINQQASPNVSFQTMMRIIHKLG